MELLDRLRNAVKKLTFLLNLKKFLTTSTWQVASSIRARVPAAITGPHHWRRRAYSFNDRPGLRACVEIVVVSDDDYHHQPMYGGDEDGYNGGPSESSSGAASPYPLRRASSYPMREDVDNQAEMFIENFYKHLVYEKQVSLNLRYCRDTSSSTFTDDSTVSSLSSAGSQLVSPT